MSNYSIGISGLGAAQKALDIIGNNIANAATEGYHRQRIELTPAYSTQVGNILLGGGVNVTGVSRVIDSLLEQEILRQQSLLEQVSQEFVTLHTVESAFGEFTTEDSGLNAAIDKFFNALQDLSTHPSEIIWQDQAVSAAEAMAGQFRTLGEFLTTLQAQIKLEAENVIESINTLITQIAELNGNIERMEAGGQRANNLRDQRDQCIAELSELAGIQTQSREHGIIDVNLAGIPVVAGTFVAELEVGSDENGGLGISVAGAYNYSTDVQGGRLGGLLSLKNAALSDIRDELDALACAIIRQVNQYHVQGVGSEGSFTELVGWPMASENLADFNPPITSESVVIRVTDTTVPGTTTIERYEVDIANDLPADPTLSDFADYINNNVTGLTVSVSASKLCIQADTNYKFDFLPCVLSEPDISNLTAASPPTVSVSGIYTGTEKQTFTFMVQDTGSVGNNTLRIEVKNGDGEVVTTVNVGSGYSAGDKIDIGDGIKISLGTGDLKVNDTFEIEAFANTDTSGLLAAVGINTFFSGSSAADIAVCSDISTMPGRIATALGADMTDNTNALRLAGLRDQAISSLSSMTPGEFYRRLVTNIGQQSSIKQMRQDSIEVMVQNLANQQSEMSGVNINDEAAKLLIFEQMFQAMAKYMNTVQSSVSAIMEII